MRAGFHGRWWGRSLSSSLDLFFGADQFQQIESANLGVSSQVEKGAKVLSVFRFSFNSPLFSKIYFFTFTSAWRLRFQNSSGLASPENKSVFLYDCRSVVALLECLVLEKGSVV